MVAGWRARAAGVFAVACVAAACACAGTPAGDPSRAPVALPVATPTATRTLPGAPALPLVASEQAVASSAGATEDDRWVLNAGGDVTYPFGYIDDPSFEREGPALFAELAPLLAEGDLSFANLEGPFSDWRLGDAAHRILVTPSHRLGWLVAAGFNLFSLANNHSLDGGGVALLDTLASLRSLSTPERPLFWAGTAAEPEASEEPARIELAGKRGTLAFFAVGPAPLRGVDWLGSPTLLERIRRAAREVTAVVVSVHSGVEYVHVPSAELCARYRALVDAGARIVFGHHPHVAQGVERYRDGVIFYSLGNLSFGTLTNRARTGDAILYGLFARVVLRGGRLEEVRAHPLYLHNSEPLRLDGEAIAPRFARPRLLRGAFAAQAAERLEQWSRAIPGAGPAELGFADDAIVVRAPLAAH